MKYIYHGPFSGGTETHVAMGVGFRGRAPSETADAAAIAWFTGNPLFEEVPEEAHPLDHDANGEKGGSLKGGPRKKKATK